MPGTFSLFGTTSHERCKLFFSLLLLWFFSMLFFFKEKKSCGLMCWQSKRVYIVNSLSEYLHSFMFDGETCRSYKGLLNVYYWKCAFPKHNSNIVQVISSVFVFVSGFVRLSTSSPASKYICVCVRACFIYSRCNRCIESDSLRVLSKKKEKNNFYWCFFFCLPPGSKRLINVDKTFKGNICDRSITVQLYTKNNTVTWMCA